jgi:hypothetical protein
VSVREGIGVAVGASLSFALGLVATSHNAKTVLLIGLVVSAVILAALLTMSLVRGPWLSVSVVPFKSQRPGTTTLRLEFRNHGYQSAGSAIINVLVPETYVIADCDPFGNRKTTQSDLFRVDESVDGRHGSMCWNRKLDLTPGTHAAFVLISATEGIVPMRVRIGKPRRSLHVDLAAQEQEHDIEYARVRPWVARRLDAAGRSLRRLLRLPPNPDRV